jgi:bifunctional isochorismate lyase/aryl carrier protein
MSARWIKNVCANNLPINKRKPDLSGDFSMAIPKLTSYPLPAATELPTNKVKWALESGRAALLIHDMQRYFLNFWGENSPLVEQVVDNIARLRRYCKAQGIPVFYTAQPNAQSDEDRALLNDMWGPGLNKHPDQQKIVDALAPDADDHVLTKWRYSAFHRSPLESILQEMGRDQLIITGVYAHIGCLTTATDGRSGKVVMTADLMPLPLSKDDLRALILPLLEDDDVPEDDENLIDYGLDSVRVMALAARWRQVHGDIDFVSLAKNPSIDGWWALLSREPAQ